MKKQSLLVVSVVLVLTLFCMGLTGCGSNKESGSADSGSLSADADASSLTESSEGEGGNAGKSSKKQTEGIGSIAGNLLQGGLLAYDETDGELYFSAENFIWAWQYGNAASIVNGENIRFLNIWDGYMYYLSGSAESGDASGCIYKVELNPEDYTDLPQPELVVSDMVESYLGDIGSEIGFYIRDSVLYYNSETRTGQSSYSNEVVSYDLKTGQEKSRQAGRQIVAVTDEALFYLEDNNNITCEYNDWNGSSGSYVIDSLKRLTYKSNAAMASVDGACYYYVADWAKDTCKIMEISPAGEKLAVDVAGNGYDSAIALNAYNGKILFEVGIQDKSMLGSPEGMRDSGLVSADIGGTRFEMMGDDISSRYVYGFDSPLVYYGFSGNIYCQNNDAAAVQAHPPGFSVITEPKPNVALKLVR